MSLRPRYSLLTLLILTALVASGVKLWRGPQRTIMSDPPTAEEQAILDTFQERHEVLKRKDFTFRYEVESRREWQGTRVLSLKMIPLQQVALYHFDEPAEQQARIMSIGLPTAWPDEDWQELLAFGIEEVVCLLSCGHQQSFNGLGLHYNPVYVLTKQKLVYEMQGYWGGNLVVQPIRIEWVRDPDLRAKIQTELALLPDPQ